MVGNFRSTAELLNRIIFAWKKKPTLILLVKGRKTSDNHKAMSTTSRGNEMLTIKRTRAKNSKLRYLLCERITKQVLEISAISSVVNELYSLSDESDEETKALIRGGKRDDNFEG